MRRSDPTRRDPAKPGRELARPGRGRLVVGVAARPHGLRGELNVRLFNRGSDVLDRAKSLWLAGQEYALVGVRAGNDGVFVRLEGVGDRDAAAALGGNEVEVLRELVDLADGEFLLADLVGCAVFDSEERPLGRVVANWLAGQDRLVGHDEDSELIGPALPEFLARVDLAARKIWVELPEGLPRQPLSPKPKS